MYNFYLLKDSTCKNSKYEPTLNDKMLWLEHHLAEERGMKEKQ